MRACLCPTSIYPPLPHLPCCRALAAASPFPVARENLVTHFEQIRTACERMVRDTQRQGPAAATAARGQRPASQVLKELRMR